MDAVATAALPIFALILTGWLAARWGILGPSATDALNRYVAYLSLPALLFHAMAQADLGLMSWYFVASVSGGIAITFAVTFVIARRRGARLTDLSIQALAASYANAGYMGIPLCLSLLGPASLAPAIICTLFTACVLFSVAIALVEFDQHRDHSLGTTLIKVMRALIRNPLLIAPLAGLAFALSGAALPAGIDRYVELLGASASPCALVTIGLFLAQAESGGDRKAVVQLVAAKLLLHPAATAVLVFLVFPIPTLWAWTAVLMSALPIGSGPFMLAHLYERDARTASRAILISTVLSVITVSLLVAWISQQPLP